MNDLGPGPIVRAVKAFISGVFWHGLGRRNMVRFGRFLLNAGRLDAGNNMQTNGERMLQREVLRLMEEVDPLVVFDVGANVGLWTCELLGAAVEYGSRQYAVHAFEPSRATFDLLCSQIQQVDGGGRVTVVNKALSSQAGARTLYVAGRAAGTNSLHAQTLPESRGAETVQVSTVDEYCAANAIERIALLKIDTEGHDLSVIEGALGMLEREAIDFIQFEYTWRWIPSRRYLKDVFDLMRDREYRIGKITPKGLEFYANWAPELESFQEGNYLIALERWVPELPLIPWWNDTR